MRKRQKKVVNFSAFITIIVMLTGLSTGLGYFLQVKGNEVVQINKTLEEEQKKTQELKLEFEETKKQNEQLNKQIAELKEQVKELQLKTSNKTSNTNVKEDTKKVAYLTFDDGPSDNTAKILDFLKQTDIKATFFVTGHPNQIELYKRIVNEGHALGNHTYGHDYNGIYKSTNTFFEDVEKLNDFLEEVTGERTKILRFPGGSNNTVSRRSGGEGIMKIITQKATEDGYRYFDWNVDSQDAAKSKQSKDVIVKSVLSGAKYTNHAVILMHDAPAKTTTVDALPGIVEGLKQQGFTFEALGMNTPKVQFQ